MHDDTNSSSGTSDWLLEPMQVVSTMLDRGMLMFRAYGGPYFLSAERGESSPIFVPDTAVDYLLERGLLTRVEDSEATDGLYLLTAEGRRTAATERSKHS